MLLLVAGTTESQTLLTQTTWGGVGSDVAEAVATAADGSAYLVGITDSFTTDQFGQPSPRIFIVKFATTGAVTWQRIWNGTTVGGLGRPDVAVDFQGSVYVTGVSVTNGNDAVLLKFDANGNLLWERTWGGAASDEAKAVATSPIDGSVYIAGTETSFGTSAIGLFVVKFDTNGTLVWQKFADGTEGNGVTVGSDGSVYAAGTVARNQIGDFDMLAIKMSDAGAQVWRRAYSAGDVADARGRIVASPDGSVVVAGAIQSIKGGTPDITALVVKLSAAGTLVFDKQFDGRVGETGDGVGIAPDDGTIYLTGTTTSFGAGSQDAFVLHIQATGKRLLDAVTWGGTAFEVGSGVSVTGGTVVLGATTNAGPPYSLLTAAAKLSAPRGTLSTPAGDLADATGASANLGLGTTTPAGSTTFGGNFEAAVVRILR
jgi:hypothetical protein